MTLDVVNSDNEKVGSVDLNDAVFAGPVKLDLVWESVVRANASERRGTHMTKNRALVSGSGKKPYKQKGTGRPQVGSTRTPLWRHGGTVFGPQPRSYDYALPKKVERGALLAALTAKLQGGAVIVVDQLAGGEGKTKPTAALLKRLGATGKTLIVDVKLDETFERGGAQPRRRDARGERPADGARRDEHLADHRDPRRRRAAAGGVGMKVTEVIRRPLVTEKTTIAREASGEVVVFEVAPRRDEDRYPPRGREAVRVEGRVRAHADHARQDQAAGPVRRPAAGLEEGLGPAEGRGESARVHGRDVADAYSQLQAHVGRPAIPERPDVRRDHDVEAVQAAGRERSSGRAGATTAARSPRGGAAAATSATTG